MKTSSREIEMQAAAPATAGYVALASFPETDPASRHSPRPTRARAPFAAARKLDELDLTDVEEGAAALADAASRAREEDGFSTERRFETTDRLIRSPRSLGSTTDRTFVELVFARKSTSLRKALALFAEMQQRGLQPSAITYSAVISACEKAEKVE